MQKLIEDQKPTGYTDMSICLGKILNKHRLKLMEQRAKHPYWKRGNTAPVRPLSIYVLTDGNWQPGCDLAPSIESLVETMLSLGMKRSQVGIQFISFGDDKDGLERLAYLENLQRRENLGLLVQKPLAIDKDNANFSTETSLIRSPLMEMSGRCF